MYDTERDTDTEEKEKEKLKNTKKHKKRNIYREYGPEEEEKEKRDFKKNIADEKKGPIDINIKKRDKSTSFF